MPNRPDPKNRVYFQEYEGKRILNLDVSELDDVEDSLYLMEIAKTIIFNEPPKSVRLLSNVTNTRYNKGGISRMQDFSKSITPLHPGKCHGRCRKWDHPALFQRIVKTQRSRDHGT